MKHVVCYSGGHSSGIVAIEVVRRYGANNVILLNHDISSHYEDSDIKRFKKEISDYLGIPITYKNYNDLPIDQIPNQFEVCEKLGSFVNPSTRQALCTAYLKTIPFSKYLETYFPSKDCVIYYGFDENETERINRRYDILNEMGYKSDYPLSWWTKGGIDKYNKYQIKKASLVYRHSFGGVLDTIGIDHYLDKANDIGLIDIIKYDRVYSRTIYSTLEVNITPPNIYNNFKHANCIGCLKGGQQHWYVVFVKRPDIFNRAKQSENEIGHSIIKNNYLKDLEIKFNRMKCAGVPATEHIPFQSFWALAKKYLKEVDEDVTPCECVL